MFKLTTECRGLGRAPSDRPEPYTTLVARCRLAACLTALLAACGGGGGGGGEPPAPPPVATTSGLVPAEPALGEVLESDAASLRPLADGATWDYHGQLRRLPADTSLAAYSTRRSLRLSAGGYDETESNGANQGESTSTVRLSAGRIEQPTTLQLPGRPAEQIVGVELRSPVRIGDQIVSFDRRITEIPDLDGDGRTDAIDAAVYVRVIGRERVELPTLPAVQAVRVDISIRLRARYSRDSSVSPVDETVQRFWYARGLGIVRAQLEEDSDTLLSRVVAEEWLVAHRRPGMAVGPQAARSAQVSGAPVTTPIIVADRFFFHWGNDTLWLQREAFQPARWLSFDADGLTTSERTSAYDDVRGQWRQGESGAASLYQPGTGPVMRTAAFSREGLRLGTGPTEADFSERNPLKTVNFRGSVADGDVIWHELTTQERVFSGPETFVIRQVLRGVNRLTGAFASPEIDIGFAPLAQSEMAVSGGVLRQVRGRVQPDGRVTLWLMSVPLSPLGTPQWLELASGLPDTARTLALHALADGRMVLLWRGNFEHPAFGSAPLAGVVIRGDGSLLRGAAASLAAETLAAVPADAAFQGVRGQRLWFSRAERGLMLAGEPFFTDYFTYWAVDVGAPAVAVTPAQMVRVRARHLAGADFAGSADWGPPLLLTDRLMWLYRGDGSGGTGLATQIVHLPAAPVGP